MDELRATLNGETALMPWTSLARFFARGETVEVATEVSLLDVAVAFATDNKAEVERWMAAGVVGPVSDASALAWQEKDVWTVVVKPWVLVQYKADG